MRISRIISPFHTLYTRLTLWVMLTVFLVFAVITVLMALVTSGAVMKETTDNARSRMEIANQHINSVLVGVEVAIANTIPEVEGALDEPDRMYDVVTRLLQLNPNITGSAVAFEPNYYPSKGKQFSPYAYRSADSTILTKQLGTEDYEYHYMDWYLIPTLLKKTTWSEPYYDHGGGELMMTTFSHPLIDQKGHIYGVITADVSLEWLTKLVQENDIDFNRYFQGAEESSPIRAGLEHIDKAFLYNHAYTFIVGKGGAYIAHPLSERILNETYFTYVVESEDSVDLKIGYAMVDGEQGIKQIDRDGTIFLVNYAPIERTGWSMATVIPAKLIYHDAFLFSGAVIILMLIGLVILFFVCRTMLKRVTKPLTRFAESADEISRGNLNASLPKIKTHDEMRRLHDSFAMMQTSLTAQMEELKLVNEQKGRIQGELQVASDIQMSMIPKTFPPFPNRQDIEIFGSLTPAKEVGGDLYDFYIRDEKLFFCIGDVSGKGVPASLVMAVTRSLFRNVSAHVSTPDQIMRQMNEALSDQNDSLMFVTLFLGVLDLATGRMLYSNAGHGSPLMIDEATKRMEKLPCTKNIPLGVMGDMEFVSQETTISRRTLIFLYTDGVTEAMDSNDQMFGVDKMYETIRQYIHSSEKPEPKKLISNMADAVHEFVGEAEQSDDLTMMAIRYH